MVPWLTLGLHLGVAALKSRRNLALENLALRHQLLVLSRGSNRPRLTPLDRALWVWLSLSWKGWETSLRFPKWADCIIVTNVGRPEAATLRGARSPPGQPTPQTAEPSQAPDNDPVDSRSGHSPLPSHSVSDGVLANAGYKPALRALRFMGSLHIQRFNAHGDHERSTFNAQRSTNLKVESCALGV